MEERSSKTDWYSCKNALKFDIDFTITQVFLLENKYRTFLKEAGLFYGTLSTTDVKLDVVLGPPF